MNRMSLTAMPLCGLAMAMMLSGCAHLEGGNEIVLRESGRPSAGAPVVKNGVTIRMLGYEDGRKLSDPRWLGHAEGKVVGLHGTEIRLDRDAHTVVEASLAKKLDDTGATVILTEEAPAIFEASGVIRELRYDVKARDEIAVSLETTLRDAVSKKVVWSGVVSEKQERFAGVVGNNKRDIAILLGQALAVVTGKTAEAINTTLLAARPELFALTPGTQLISGVTVYSAAPAAPAPLPVPGGAVPLAAAGTGKLVVSTEPARARVYLDGVYYGLSPLSVDMPAGVHAVQIKLKGYRSASEKVAIRAGDKTELEWALER